MVQRNTLGHVLSLIGVIALLSSPVVAHPGHGTPGVNHYLSDLGHSFEFLVAILALGFLVVTWAKKRRSI